MAEEVDRTTTLPPLPLLAADDPSVRAKVQKPRKCILNDDHIEIWRESETHDLLVLFLMRLGEACVDAPTRCIKWSSSAYTHSQSFTDHILSLLIKLDGWTDEIAPQTGPQRFGNLAFRTWGARLTEQVESLHRQLLPEHLQAYIPELSAYFLDAFGSFVRIDYGTGHELHFVAWLCYLTRLGAFGIPCTPDEETRLALEVFPAYLRVVWHLQDRYALEPAGSHGVWGLDDYQFVPYIFGAAQLRHANLSPLQMTDMALYPFVHQHTPRGHARLSPAETLAYEAPKPFGPQPNLYTSSLARVHSLKRGPFMEHSPILYDIAQNVPTWVKVYKGMLKMYDAECLLKRPVVQHFPFGNVGFPWPSTSATASSSRYTSAPSRLTSMATTTMPPATARPSHHRPTNLSTTRFLHYGS